LENLKLAKTANYVSFTNKGPVIHTQISFKLFNTDTLSIAGSHNGNIAISASSSTNFIILPSNYEILMTKMRTIFVTGRHILHHKLHSTWHDEFKFAFNFKLISPNLFTTTKEIQAHISCGEEIAVTKIPTNSLINIPLTCSLATDFFTIHKLLSTSGISARHEIDFLKITFGVNTTDVVGVTHITLTHEKIHKLRKVHIDTADYENTTTFLDPIIQTVLISAFFSLLPWLFVCAIVNLKK
jgi:hypothetical protein